MVYDLTNLTNSTSVLSYIQIANELTNGFLINVFLGGLFVILLITFKMYETNDSLIAASFITFLMALFMRFSSTALIGDGTFYFWFAAVLASGIAGYLSREL